MNGLVTTGGNPVPDEHAQEVGLACEGLMYFLHLNGFTDKPAVALDALINVATNLAHSCGVHQRLGAHLLVVGQNLLDDTSTPPARH